MKQVYIFVLIAFLLPLGTVFGQNGIIQGIVKDGQTGEAMMSATIMLKQGDKVVNGAYTDENGAYKVQNVVPGTYTLTVTYVTFEPIIMEGVQVAGGQTLNLEHVMGIDKEAEEKNTVTIQSKVVQNTEASLITVQRKSTNVIDAISSQQLSRTGDANAAAALSRVSGLSVEGGKYVYVRGLSDRYSKTTLNGSELPNLDPNRNTVQMDMFPTGIIDNIIVYKNFSPDLPGSFTGGLVDIRTRDFPDKFTVRYSSSFGANTQASFRNNVPTAQKGKTDFLGIDDGTRAMPDEFGTGVIPKLTFKDGVQANALDEVTKSFDTGMLPTRRNTTFNHNHNFSIGNQWNIRGKQLGFIASLSYRTQDNYYTNGESQIWKITGEASTVDSLNNERNFRDTSASREVLWGGMMKWTLRPAIGHKISAVYMHNQSGESGARILKGTAPNLDNERIFETSVLSFQQRSMDAAQVNGDHLFENAGKLKMDWIASYTRSGALEPDLRFFTNDRALDGSDPSIQPSLYQFPARFYRDLSQNNINGYLNFEIPFLQWEGFQSKVKFGTAYNYKDRTFRERRYEYKFGSGITPYDGDADAFFDDSNLGIVDQDSFGNYIYGLYMNDATQRANNYDASQHIVAGYAMVEMPLLEHLKLIAGARYELTSMDVSSQDPGKQDGTLFNNDILPSVNLIFNPVDNMNLRAAYTRTLARPSFREIAPFSSFEFVGDFVKTGNPELKRSLQDNFDLRWEWFPSTKEMISVSGFYKNFNNPIEEVIVAKAGNLEKTWRNVDNAKLLGGEIEIRKQLDFISPKLKDLRAGVNASFVYSRVAIDPDELAGIRAVNPEAKATRPFFGQSPFTINAELSYQNDSLGINTSLNFNIFGSRIAAVGGESTPNIFEKPRPRLDFFFSKNFKKNWSVTFRARNLINPKYLRVQEFKDVEYVASSYTVGRTFSLGFAYFIR